MIHEVDDTLRALIERDALNGSDVEIAFDAPTKDWTARRNAPTINAFLYDVREDVKRREVGSLPVREPSGEVTDRRLPARRYKLAYLLTAWTQRPEDEHRLLSQLLTCFVNYDELPPEILQGGLADTELPLPLFIALPQPQDRSDIWSALGGEMKPSLDLSVIAPLEPDRSFDVGPPVVEEPRIRIEPGEAGKPAKKTKKKAKTPARRPAAEDDPDRAGTERIQAGTDANPGRVMRFGPHPADEEAS